MPNRSYLTLEDGTVIDDAYIKRTVDLFDKALRSGTASIEPNPHYHEPFKATFSKMPKYLQHELKPFFLSS